MPAYITCITTAPQQVPAYFYAGTEQVLTMSDSPAALDRTGLILSVQDPSRAQYQADRLSSGLHGARVHETFHDAAAHLLDRLVAGKHTAAHPELLQAARVQTRAPQTGVSRSR